MFSQVPEEEPQKNSKLPTKKRNKKRKKKTNQTKNIISKKNRKRYSRISTTMSEWAERFTFAATWQLKHQVAYWKARAKSLEYENQLLHDIIRRNHGSQSVNGVVEMERDSESEGEESIEDKRKMNSLSTVGGLESDRESNETVEDDDNPGSEDFEVSEEFIQFLMANAKYKEDAKRERERFKANQEAGDLEREEESITVDRESSLKELYGDQWQRMSALEMSLDSHFIHETDKSKPQYWPILPLNFNFK